MNKLYNLLTAAVICSAAHGLIASEEPAKPFLDPKTQDVVKNTAKYYALGYVGIYGVAGVGAFLLNVLIPAKCGTMPVKFRGISVGELACSIPVTAPIAFGGTLACHKDDLSLSSAYHKCQEYLCEKNAA